MATLTEDAVLARTRTGKLSSVKNLNCWGSQLTDVSVLSKLQNAEVLCLSVNQISSLGPFRACVGLKELFLRKNNVSDIRELRHLSGLRHLRVLWLSDNPVEANPHYRATVIRTCPYLVKLDNRDVTPQERRAAAVAGLVISDTHHQTEDNTGNSDPKEAAVLEAALKLAEVLSPASLGVLAARIAQLQTAA
eukprot:m.486934 g.486934  ORF g.486934 m.486934 type:complete len:192 (-) comp24690_c0_seq1:277-852(-)